jgi:hypothetical protein
MVRLAIGLTAWLAGTAIAVSVAWFGANVVVRNAGVGPGIPVISSSVLPSAVAFPATGPPTTGPPTTGSQAAATPPATGGPTATASAGAPAPDPTAPARSASGAGGSPSASASPRPSASATAGDIHAYTLTGGIVTLNLANNVAQLVTAVPNAGYSVQTWSGTGWLRVDFSSGPQVSSLIASWYLHAPTVTVEN